MYRIINGKVIVMYIYIKESLWEFSQVLVSTASAGLGHLIILIKAPKINPIS